MAVTLSEMVLAAMGKKIGERPVPHGGPRYRPKCWRCALGWLIRRPHMVLVPIYDGGALQQGILENILAQSRLMEHLPFVTVGDPQTWPRRETLPEVD